MSAREWKSGTVAMVTSGDVKREDPRACGEFETVIGVRTGRNELGKGGWNQADGHWIADEYVYEVRLLVVIDPEDREQVERLTVAIHKAQKGLLGPVDDDVQSALRSLVAPPKPEEPGVWGVVEASCCHSDERRKWVRHEDNNWWPAEIYGDARAMSERVEKGRDPRLPDCWDDLVDPVLIRDGVAS